MMRGKKDYSTKVGGRRKATGNDVTAGNSVKSPSISKVFKGDKVQAVSRLASRFQKTRTRRG